MLFIAIFITVLYYAGIKFEHFRNSCQLFHQHKHKIDENNCKNDRQQFNEINYSTILLVLIKVL